MEKKTRKFKKKTTFFVVCISMCIQNKWIRFFPFACVCTGDAYAKKTKIIGIAKYKTGSCGGLINEDNVFTLNRSPRMFC